MRKALHSRVVNVLKQRIISASQGCSRCISSTSNTTDALSADNYTIESGDDSSSVGYRLNMAGRAMETYLNEARNYSNMMAKEREQYELGKRHLANIMGLDADNITQNDIDRAVEYLFPSGLTDKKALPVLKPPEEIFPKFLVLKFGQEGRPSSPLFYTGRPDFYAVLSEIGIKTLQLTQEYYSKSQHQKGSKEQQTLILTGTTWLDFEEVKKKLGLITEEMYAHIILALENLTSLPLAWKEKDFIFEYRKPLTGGVGLSLFGPPVPQTEINSETQRRFARAQTTVKRTTAHTTVMERGTGKEIFLAPLIITDLLGKVDIVSEVEGPGGQTVIPRVVRHGVALCIAALFPEHFEILRLAGLLTRDPRRKERHKVNQPGARAKWIWKKR